MARRSFTWKTVRPSRASCTDVVSVAPRAGPEPAYNSAYVVSVSPCLNVRVAIGEVGRASFNNGSGLDVTNESALDEVRRTPLNSNADFA